MLNVYTSASHMSSFFYPWYKFLYSCERRNIARKNQKQGGSTAKKCLYFIPLILATGWLLPRLLFFHCHFIGQYLTVIIARQH